MSQVLDYSAGFPGAAAIKQAGYVGAVRYIGFPDRRKCTNAAELADFDHHQLGMALVFEGAASDWRGGYSAGQVNGRRGRDHANTIGFSAGRPIYMAVDQDVVKTGEFAIMLDYLRGAGSSLGGASLTGVYGEADVIDAARTAGVATRFWQTAAWSRGRRTTAHLFQRVGTVYVGGVACDVSDVLAPDWGQHNVTTMEGTGVSAQDVTTALSTTKWEALGNRNVIDALAETMKRVLAFTDNDVPAIRAGLRDLSDDEVRIITAARDMITNLDTGGNQEQLAAVITAAVRPLVQLGASPEQVQAAVDAGIRAAFGRVAGTEGDPS